MKWSKKVFAVLLILVLCFASFPNVFLGESNKIESVKAKTSLLPPPTLYSPYNGETVSSTTPTFSWSSVSGANKYWLIVATSLSALPTDPKATSAPYAVISKNVTSTSYTPTTPLNYDTTYYWEVQPFNDSVSPIQQGQYSAQQSFRTPIQSVQAAHPVITSSLEITLEKDRYYVGDRLTAKFTIKNVGSESIVFDKLLVGGRFNGGKLPNGEYPNFTPQSPTLDPGQSYLYEGTLELTEAGNYHFFCAYQTPDGSWNPSIELSPGLTDKDRVKDIEVLLPEGPYISSIDPPSGAPGIEVTIRGINFGNDPGMVDFEAKLKSVSAKIVSWTDKEIIVKVPSPEELISWSSKEIEKGIVNVYIPYGFFHKSNEVTFTYTKPSIDHLDPKVGLPGQKVVIKGRNFGFIDPKEGLYGHISFGNSQVHPEDIASASWTDTEIEIKHVPSDYGTGINDAKIMKDLIDIAMVPLVTTALVGKELTWEELIKRAGKEAIKSELLSKFPNLVTLKLYGGDPWWKSFAKIFAVLAIPGVEIRPEADEKGLIYVHVTVETSAGKDDGGLFTYVIPLSITDTTPPFISTSLPSQPTGSTYSVRFNAVGGISPYKWSVNGDLPLGLNLNTITGILSGTLPPTPKTYEFIITVQDSGQDKDAPVQTVSKKFSLTVSPPEVWRVIPNSVNQGIPWLKVNIIGTGFTSPVTLDFGKGIVVYSSMVKSNNNIEVVITVSNDAPIGKRNVSVTTSGVTITLRNGFTLESPLYWTASPTTKGSITIVLKIEDPYMIVNGVSQEIDPGRGTAPILIKEGKRAVAPIRAIIESLGGKVAWDEKEGKVTINFKDTTIELWIDNPKAKVDGKETWIDSDNHNVKPVIQNDRTMLPLRFVAESLGCKVEWEPNTQTITITYPGS